jgi:hypothetical protein
MDDLEKLNRTIAAHWLGSLDAEQEAYLGFASMCIGQLAYTASELAEQLDDLRRRKVDSRHVAKLNRRYLRFARLAAKDAVVGKLDAIVRLGITLELAEVLCNLSDEDLDRLAYGSEGLIVKFAGQAFDRGTALHGQAGKHHATAFVAARLSGRTGEQA